MCGRGTPPNWPKSKKCAPNGPVLIGARLGPWFYGLTENHIFFGAPRNAHFWAARVAITCNTHDFAGNRFAFFCLAAQHTHRHATDMHFRAHRQTRRGHRQEFPGSQTRHRHEFAANSNILATTHNNFTPTHTI